MTPAILPMLFLPQPGKSAKVPLASVKEPTRSMVAVLAKSMAPSRATFGSPVLMLSSLAWPAIRGPPCRVVTLMPCGMAVILLRVLSV